MRYIPSLRCAYKRAPPDNPVSFVFTDRQTSCTCEERAMTPTMSAFALSPSCTLRGTGRPTPTRLSPLTPAPLPVAAVASVAPTVAAQRRVRELMYGAGGAFRGLAAHFPNGGNGSRAGGGGHGDGDEDFHVDPSWGVAPGVHVVLRGRSDEVYAAAVANLIQMSQVLPSPAQLVGDPSVPVVVLLSWMGAQQKQLSKYATFYEDMGYEVHCIFNGFRTAILPRASREQAEKVERFISAQPDGRPVFVHAFSIGTGIYGLLLDRLRGDLERLEGVKKRVAGVVFDSGPAPIFPHDVAKGLHTVFPIISKAIWEPIAGLFFAVTRARKSFGASEEALAKFQFPSPQLYFYSLDDKVIPNIHHAIEDFIDKNRQLGVEVYNKWWKKSIHASHLKMHQEEYTANLEKFVKRCMQLHSTESKAS